MKVIKRKPDKKTVSWIILLFAFSFMIFFFAPLEAYFSNSSELWFTVGKLLPVITVCFIIAFIILAIIGVLIGKTKASLWCFGFILALYIFLYFQGNYVPRNYGVMDGNEVDWGAYKAYGTISIVLIVLAIALWIILCKKFKEKTYTIGRYVCIFLLLIQAVTLVTLAIGNREDKVRTHVIVTDKGMFDFSSDENVIVVLVDTFDGDYMRELLDSDDAEWAKETLADFTYYDDTVGMYPTTKGALPNILTGTVYRNEVPFADHVTNSYNGNEFWEALKDNNYQAFIYTNDIFVRPDLVDYTNTVEGEYVLTNPVDFAKKVYKLVGFNYMPHQLKPLFVIDSAEFEAVRTTSTGYDPYLGNNQRFYEKIQTREYVKLDNVKCFNFYHIAGTHTPYTFGKDLVTEEGVEYTAMDETRGCITLLGTFFDRLREEGLYDNSVIIIMADHGHNGMSQNPTLFIKNRNEKHAFKKSSVKVSFADINTVFEHLVEGNDADEAYMKSLERKSREYLYYSWDDSWDRTYLPAMKQYFTEGFAGDEDEFVFTGEEYVGGDVDYTYELGTEIKYGKDDPKTTYWVFGKAKSDAPGTWVTGKTATFRFNVSGQDYKDLKVQFNIYNTLRKNETVIAYANGHQMGKFVLSGACTMSFDVPGEYIEDGMLELYFEMPDVKSPAEITNKSKDKRLLSIRIASLVITAK
ncbi:MAG: sulfatase-like hydrolase/transferase [Lachnospiraceae bacterium]|nr:sulfatase-like hydrolase/transferase [Lachnospiraceae bacterium]